MDEAERIGIDPNDFIRQAIVTVLEAPRRREDYMAIAERLDDLERRIEELEAEG